MDGSFVKERTPSTKSPEQINFFTSSCPFNFVYTNACRAYRNMPCSKGNQVSGSPHHLHPPCRRRQPRGSTDANYTVKHSPGSPSPTQPPPREARKKERQPDLRALFALRI